MALHLYLIRHGRTEWNNQGLLQGSGDSPLVEEGIVAAQKTAVALADIPFSACYSSMQKRAQDTANYILNNRDIPHFHHKGLNEINFGLWEGMRSADLADHPEAILMKTQPALYKAEANQGETIEQLYQRTTKALQQIINHHRDGENVLIVSHGFTLTLLTAVIKGLHWHDFRDETKHRVVQNTAINIIKVENGKPELIVFNQTDHLA